MRWAWAHASLRKEPDVQVRPLDVLAGLLVAHGDDSEPWQLFRYFGVAPGSVLATDGAPTVNGPRLRAAFGRTTDGPPPMDREAEFIVNQGLSDLTRFDTDGFLTFKALFGALLLAPTPAATALRTALDERGAPSSVVFTSYLDYLAGPEGYGEFLAARFPWPPPLQLPAYATDRPPGRQEQIDPADPGDLVRISAEVDAFAFLIASVTLPPPLAIGLFGDWGSGKSYFLRSLQRRIDRLLADGDALPPDQALPFHRSIAQIEFNAWQYVQGDLWASLLDHIIRNLKPTTNDENLVDRARRAYLGQIKETTDQAAALRRQKAALEAERDRAAAEIERREAQHAAALAELRRQRDEHPIRALVASPQLKKTVEVVAEKAGVGAVVAQSDDAGRVLAESRAAARQAGGLVTAVRQGGRYVVYLLVLILATPALVWGVSQFDTSAVTQAAAAVASLLATALGALKTGNHAMAALLKEADDAERKLREADDAATASARERLASATDRLAEAETAQAEVAGRLVALDEKLAGVTPALVLDDFLKDRLGSDDYRRYLGLPAIVRRDLEQLSDIIDKENTQPGRAGKGTRINRVVLYIDDLDRCPTDVVLQVLQAVHLLLAFKLFVVVVAVDSRWLAGSLQAHYDAQLRDGVTPDDYLEKIFQVAFWVQPMDEEARRRMVRGLLARNVASDTSDTATSEATDAGNDVDAGLDGLVEAMYDSRSEAPPWLEAATLAVTPAELAFIEGLAPLLGDTPRSVKRFVNVFQLVKTIARAEGPVDDRSLERILFLLAVSTGPPATAQALFTAIQEGPATRTLGALANTLADGKAIQAWLKDNPRWRRVHAADLRDWVGPVRRFWFRAPPAVSAGGSPPATAPGRPAAASEGAPGGP